MSRRNNILALSLLIASAMAAQAQIEAPKPYHLAHLRGFFVDEKGNPIPGAAVTLDQDDKVIYSTQTNNAGRFEIKHVSGRYWLHLHMKGYSTVGREVIVGLEALTYLHSQTLYIIAGPGACSDDCASVFTSKGQFNYAIRRNTGHYQ
ncbi:MAG: carboxypeptidase-like regulatory domain-containing protein [Terracidiphilus sp.]